MAAVWELLAAVCWEVDPYLMSLTPLVQPRWTYFVVLGVSSNSHMQTPLCQ